MNGINGLPNKPSLSNLSGPLSEKGDLTDDGGDMGAPLSVFITPDFASLRESDNLIPLF